MAEGNCLVTGGGGFLGSHLVEALLMEGWRVKVLECNAASGSNMTRVAKQVQVIEGSFGDRELAHKALQGVDVLFHFASTTTPSTAYGHSVFDVATNLVDTLHLFEEAMACGVTRIFFPSSGGTIYGVAREIPTPETHCAQPICSHGIVKLAIEHYIRLLNRERGIQYTILRYANPYGPRQRPDGPQGVVAVFIGKILMQQPIDLWGDGTVVRDLIYIDDLVQATLLSLHSKRAINEVFNIGSGEGVSVGSLIGLIEEIAGVDAVIKVNPAREFDVPKSVLAIRKAQIELGWTPAVPLREGLKSTATWIEGYLRSSPSKIGK